MGMWRRIDESEAAPKPTKNPKWTIMEWIWDYFPDCPTIDNIDEVDVFTGTMTITTKDGSKYELRITPKR